MSWFEKLKEIVKIDVTLHDLINIQINSNNSSDKAKYVEADKSLHINLNRLSPDEDWEFKQIINAVVEEGVMLLEQNSENLVRDIKIKEDTPESKYLLGFFKNKIPNDDFWALRASLYVRKRFADGTSSDLIYRLKGDIIRKYGKRGLNICNLCSSGYFENMLIPLYGEMVKYQDFTDEEFLKIYTIIIEEEAFAVFVSGSMSNIEVQKSIEGKIRKNLKYGINFVTIHGIGKGNLEKIRHVLSEIEDKYPNIQKSIQEKGNIIIAKIWFFKS